MENSEGEKKNLVVNTNKDKFLYLNKNNKKNLSKKQLMQNFILKNKEKLMKIKISDEGNSNLKENFNYEENNVKEADLFSEKNKVFKGK